MPLLIYNVHTKNFDAHNSIAAMLIELWMSNTAMHKTFKDESSLAYTVIEEILAEQTAKTTWFLF